MSEATISVPFPDSLINQLQPVSDMVRNYLLLGDDITDLDFNALKAYIHRIDPVNDDYYHLRLLPLVTNQQPKYKSPTSHVFMLPRIEASAMLDRLGLTVRQIEKDDVATLTALLEEVGTVELIKDDNKAGKLRFQFGIKPEGEYTKAVYLPLGNQEEKRKLFLSLPFKGTVDFYIDELPDDTTPDDESNVEKLDFDFLFSNRDLGNISENSYRDNQ